VSSASVESLKIDPDVDHQSVSVTVNGRGTTNLDRVSIVSKAMGRRLLKPKAPPVKPSS